MRTIRLPALGLVFLGLSVAAPAVATSYVPVSDENLVAQAAVVVVVHVRSSGPAASFGRPATDYRLEIEQVLKGSLPGSSLTVRVDGGVRPDGIGLKIWGAPSFAPGERALLFLSPELDGTWSVLHMMLGAFHEVAAGGRRWAVRDLSEAQALTPEGKAASAVDTARDFERFAAWIAARSRGAAAAADYRVPRAAGIAPPPRTAEKFTLLRDPGTDLPLRWFEFDTGTTTIGWRAHATGQSGLAGGGFSEFQTAIAAWNDDPDTDIRYVYEGTTAATGGLNNFDGINEILFNDPNGEVSSYSCANGGVLAKGGPWYDNTATATFQGTTYIRTGGADIVVNNGLACFFAASPNPSQAAAELFAHELGHTLGLGHSSTDSFESNLTLRNAVMFAFIHDDGRGAQLNADDRAGLFFIYGIPPPSIGTDFFTVTPCRLVDTRQPVGPAGGPSLISGIDRRIETGGQCGIPGSAVALSLNLTVVNPAGAGHVTLYPADHSLPSTSSVNFGPHQIRASNAVLAVSADTFAALNARASVQGAGTVDLIVDVNGYFQ